MSNIKTTATFNLNNLLSDLELGKFVIPDFQREFEWEAWDVRDLVKSIFQDYYIGTLLLWEVKDDNTKTLACEPIRGNKPQGNENHIVLDGQQRLTAMYSAFFSPDVSLSHKKAKKATFYVNIQKLESEFEDEAFFYHFGTKKEKYYSDEQVQFNEHVFPLKIFGKGGFEIITWIHRYKAFWQEQLNNSEKEEQTLKIDEILRNATSFEDRMNEVFNRYTVAYILLDGNIDIKKVCEIFTQINSKGVKLDIFDLLNAILKPHNDLRLKELWRDNAHLITYSNDPKLKVYVLQIMSIWLQNYCAPKYLYYLVPNAKKVTRQKDGSKKKEALIESSEVFLKYWHRAFKALNKGFSILSNSKDYGAIQSKFLPYLTFSPLFSAINHLIDEQPNINKQDAKQKLKLFYWANIYTQNYSGSTESKSARDYVLLQNWFSDSDKEPEIIKDFKRRYKDINFINEKSQGSSIYKAVLNLIVLNNARDFVSYDLTDYSELDDHHIVPNSWGRKNGVEAINSILNRTLITSNSNRNIMRNRLPNVYIKDMIDTQGKSETIALLKGHFINEKALQVLLRDPFTPEDYLEFINARKEAIIQGIESNIIKNEVIIETPKADVIRTELGLLERKLREVVSTNLSTISDDPYRDFIKDRIKEEIDRKIFSDMKKSPHLTFADFESFDKKLEKLTFGELANIIYGGKAWPAFEKVFKNKQQLIKRIDQLIPFRNKFAHNNDASNVELHDAKASLDWFKLILG
jgi:hypothetical protein